MNQKDKDLNDAYVREGFSKIGRVNADAVKAKQAYQETIAKINGFTKDYSAEYIERQKQDARDKYNAARRSWHEEVKKRLPELLDAISQRHAELDLSDPNWQNALKLIELGVQDIGTVKQINKMFERNQPALRALREVYKARGLHYDGGIDKMIYDVGSEFQKLQELAQDYASGRTTIGQFASKVATVAGLEGVEFDGSPDPKGFSEAVSRGAGFPVTE